MQRNPVECQFHVLTLKKLQVYDVFHSELKKGECALHLYDCKNSNLRSDGRRPV